MNKRIKSLVLSAALVASMAILGGCGSNNVGYVDSVKVANSTEKGIEIEKARGDFSPWFARVIGVSPK